MADSPDEKKVTTSVNYFSKLVQDKINQLSSNFGGIPQLFSTIQILLNDSNNIDKLFETVFQNNEGIQQNSKKFINLFTKGFIITLKMILNLLQVSINHAPANLLGLVITKDADIKTKIDDEYFGVFADYWVRMTIEIYNFLNDDKGKKDFKTMVDTVIGNMTTKCPDQINNVNDKSLIELLTDNLNKSGVISYFYLFEYNKTGVNNNKQSDNMQALIQNSIKLYMKFTGHKDGIAICKHFVEKIGKLFNDNDVWKKINKENEESELASNANASDQSGVKVDSAQQTSEKSEVKVGSDENTTGESALISSEQSGVKVGSDENATDEYLIGGKRKTKRRRTKKNKKRKTKRHRQRHRR